VVSAELHVPTDKFDVPRPWFLRAQYYDRLEADMARIPGVSDVGGTTNIPLADDPASGSLWRTDAPGAHGRRPPTSAADQWKAAIHAITPTYFSTMGIPMARGRPFTKGDRFTEEELTNPQVPRPAGVAIINESMAAQFFPHQDPIGQRIFLFDDQTFAAYRTIVGVVRDVRAESVDKPATPTVYLPYAEHPGNQLSLVLRSSLPSSSLVASVVAQLRAFDRAITITNVRPIDAIISRALSRPRFAMLLAAGFALLALTLAAIGVFGVVGFMVTARTQEIGIRRALGARAPAVVRLVLLEGVRFVIAGIAVGVIGSIVVARAMGALLYGVSPLDPPSFVAAISLLLMAAVIASVLPATRAIGVDPLRALRNE
jgi:putative ABC transport system permease protein